MGCAKIKNYCRLLPCERTLQRPSICALPPTIDKQLYCPFSIEHASIICHRYDKLYSGSRQYHKLLKAIFFATDFGSIDTYLALRSALFAAAIPVTGILIETMDLLCSIPIIFLGHELNTQYAILSL